VISACTIPSANSSAAANRRCSACSRSATKPSTRCPPAPAEPTVADCDAKLARYRAALDAGADPAVVAGWTADTQTERQRALQQCAQPPRPATDGIGHLTEEHIVTIVEELGNMITALRDADPEHKLEVYRNLGLHLTYIPQTQTVRARIDLGPHRWDSVRVRGGT
jgi:hypothetical protein